MTGLERAPEVVDHRLGQAVVAEVVEVQPPADARELLDEVDEQQASDAMTRV